MANGKTIIVDDIFSTLSPTRPFSAAVTKPQALLRTFNDHQSNISAKKGVN